MIDRYSNQFAGEHLRGGHHGGDAIDVTMGERKALGLIPGCGDQPDLANADLDEDALAVAVPGDPLRDVDKGGVRWALSAT